jgi:hypothetical protein
LQLATSQEGVGNSLPYFSHCQHDCRKQALVVILSREEENNIKKEGKRKRKKNMKGK